MATSNPFLQGSFAPVSDETTAFDLPVAGRIPAELNGRYLRNGPNPLGLDDPNYHWFLGPGMVHGVRLRDGRAEWYRNRWVRSRLLAAALGEPWASGPIHDGRDFAANTHIISHGAHLLATVEAGPLPYELSYELDTMGPCDFGGTLPGGYAAHTKLDQETGDLHAVVYYWAWDHVQHVVIDQTGHVKHTMDVPVDDGPMMHDFALTENYVVLLDLPVTFSMDAVSAGRQMPYVWNPTHQARVGLLARNRPGSEVGWFEVDPCWVFHTLNGYDDGEQVVVDLCRYEGAYDVSLMAGVSAVTLDRWIIDPVSGKVTEQRLDDRHQEFPRVDDRTVGRRHRYGYSAVIHEVERAAMAPPGGRSKDGTVFSDSLLKRDFDHGSVESHQFGPSATVGEAVFVPTSPDAGEDDGYVLAFVHDPTRDAADLVILAAQDFTAEPVARIHLPTRVPLGFHGNWISD